MIHTFEIRYELNRQSAGYCVGMLNHIGRENGRVNGKPRYYSEKTANEFLDGNRSWLRYTMEYLYLGLHQIKFTKYRINETSAQYYIYFKIEPEVFINQQYSLSLFQCNENNYDALQYHFGKMIYELFPRALDHWPMEGPLDFLPEEDRCYCRDLEYRCRFQQLSRDEMELYRYRHLYSLPYLGYCDIKRVDYTMDFHCEYPEQFMKLVKQSYFDYKRKKRKLFNKKKETYLAAYNKETDGFVIYDKQKKYLHEEYNDKPGIEELKQAAANIIRFEYVWKCRDKDKQKKFTKLNLPGKSQLKRQFKYVSKPSLCGMMPYIIQDIGKDNLRQEYYNHIGVGQWVSDYYFKKTLRESGYKKSMKRKLLEAAYLISQAKYLENAEQQFVEGRVIQRRHDEDLLVGCKNRDVFRRYIKRIRDLGLQPLRIPETKKWQVNGKALTHVSSEYDDFTPMDLGVEQHEILQLLGPDGQAFPVYERTIANLKDLYNRYKPRS